MPHSNLSLLQSINDSINFTLVSTIREGDEIKYVLSLNNGSYAIIDTVSKIFGTKQTLFSDNCNNLNKDFWNDYYNNTIDDINRPSTFASFLHEKYMINPKNVLDLGAGNCRDSIFFSKNGSQTKAIDYNGILKEEYNNLQLIKEDVELFLSTKTKLDNYELVYMRWFLHAMPYDKAGNIFKLASNILKTDSLICIELRSLNDTKLKDESIYNELDKSYTTTHKRWLYNAVFGR